MENNKIGIRRINKWNKRGDEKYLSIWWVFVIVVIALGITIAVLIFYSAETDIKLPEAGILSEKLLSCLNNQGEINMNFIKNDFNIFKECGLNEKMFESGSDFYFNVSLYDSNRKLVKELLEGQTAFEADCRIQNEGKKITAVNFPKCVFINEGRFALVVASNQIGKKVQINTLSNN